MKQMIFSKITFTFALLMSLVLMLPSIASATEPRVTKALFAIDKDQVHALDFPPFLSNEVRGGGPFSEIVNAALQKADIDAVISIHPLQRMVKYYLLQEQAMAVMGRYLSFSETIRKDLIFIPVSVLVEQFYYYKPAQPNGLSWNGQLSSLKGRVYGAHKGEDVSDFETAGISVKRGRTIGLLKMMKAGDVDFAAIPAPTVEWLIHKFMATEKANFAAMKRAAGKDVMYVIFNKKHPRGIASAAAFRKALNEMVNDGSYANMMKKHLGNGEVLKRSMLDFKGELVK